MIRILLAGIMVLGLAGCASSTVTNAQRELNQRAEAEGSPFRWEAQNVSGGGTMLYRVLLDLPAGPTRAGPQLQRDTLALIAAAEKEKQRPNPLVKQVNYLKDGREVWSLQTEGEGIAYIVDFQPSPTGGTDIKLNGPHIYEQKR